jgi:hypothetical protein
MAASEGNCPIVFKIDLAEMVGTTRARASKFMNGFKKKGFVRYNGGLQINGALSATFLQSRPLSVRRKAQARPDLGHFRLDNTRIRHTLLDRANHLFSSFRSSELRQSI